MSMTGQGSSNADDPLAAYTDPQDEFGFNESPEANRGAEGLNEP
jgi:hypothetical protein